MPEPAPSWFIDVVEAVAVVMQKISNDNAQIAMIGDGLNMYLPDSKNTGELAPSYASYEK